MSFFYHSTGISKWCRLSMIANFMKPQEYFLNTIKVIVTLIYCLIKLMYNWMLLLFIRLLVFIVLFKFMYQSIFFWRGMCMDWCYVKELYEWDEIYLCIVIYFAFNSGPQIFKKKYKKTIAAVTNCRKTPLKGMKALPLRPLGTVARLSATVGTTVPWTVAKDSCDPNISVCWGTVANLRPF